MKSSLEDERRALLEQIEASRAVYRRMLTGEPDASGARPRLHRVAATSASSVSFPRSRSVQWVLAHPLWVAGGVALLVWLVPRMIGGGARAAARRRAEQTRPVVTRSEGTLRALLTVTALLLRDPARLRAAAKLARGTWQWLQQRRHARVAASVPPAARSGAWPH